MVQEIKERTFQNHMSFFDQYFNNLSHTWTYYFYCLIHQRNPEKLSARSIFCLSIFQLSKFTNFKQGTVVYCGPRCWFGDRFWHAIFLEFDRPGIFENDAPEWRIEQKGLEVCGRTACFKGCGVIEWVCFVSEWISPSPVVQIVLNSDFKLQLINFLIVLLKNMFQLVIKLIINWLVIRITRKTCIR